MPATIKELRSFWFHLKSPPDSDTLGDVESLPNFVVQIGDFKFLVNSSVLANESEFFKVACQGKFKEANDRVITLHDDCPWIVATMIWWCYTGRLKDLSCIDGKRISQIRFATMMKRANPGYDRDTDLVAPIRLDWQNEVLLYKLADKYAITGLLKRAQSELRRELKPEPTLLCDMLQYLGTAFLQNHQELFTMILDEGFCDPKCCEPFYDEIVDRFKSDDPMMATVHRDLVLIVVELLEHAEYCGY